MFAIVADLVPPEKRLRWFGIVTSIAMIGMGAGTGTASVLAPRLGPEGLRSLSAALGVAALTILAMTLPETLRRESQEDPQSKHATSQIKTKLGSLQQVMWPGKNPGEVQRLLRDISWISLISSLAQMIIISCALFYAKIALHLSGEEMAVYGAQVMFCVAVSGVTFNTILLSLFDRCFRGNWIRIFQLMLLLDFAHSFIYIIMWSPQVLALNGLLAGASIAQPTILRSLVSQALPADVQGRASGILAAVQGMCSCVAPSLGGVLLMWGQQRGCAWFPFAVGCLSLVVASWMTSQLSMPGSRTIDKTIDQE